MNSDKIYKEISEAYRAFDANHTLFEADGNKSAGGRARKALLTIKKLTTNYRKASIEESKAPR